MANYDDFEVLYRRITNRYEIPVGVSALFQKKLERTGEVCDYIESSGIMAE